VLFKDAATVELANSIDTIALDKTGTITEGYPVVTDVINENISGNDLMVLAASIEKASEHPIGTAILQYASKNDLKLKPIQQAQAVPGLGIQATVDGSMVFLGNSDFMSQQNFHASDSLKISSDSLEKEGKSIIYIGVEGTIQGIIALSDTIRPEANDTIVDLKNNGMGIVVLTGDNKAAADTVGRITGADYVYSNLRPEDKADVVRKLQKDGHRVMMVGDGINDAISLTQADVGVAIGTGSDVAIASSDITLIGSDLRGIKLALDISSKTMLTIKQNLFWAFAYNVALIPIAAGVLYPFFSSGVPESLHFILGEFGFLNPIAAATAMAISSITVIANSLRLRQSQLS
jgi:Cu+-exporting ATPase